MKPGYRSCSGTGARLTLAEIALLASALAPAPSAGAQENPLADDPAAVSVRYDKGLEIETADGNYRFHFNLRAQLRYTNADTDEHPQPGDILESSDDFSINRGRVKLGGHAYRPWLEHYTEYDVVGNRLLDLRFNIQPKEEIGVRIGQYKVLYNRERVDSSGKQQFVERSIVTRPFTLDRQSGITMLGRLFSDTAADSSYTLGVFTGTGRGGDSDDDGRPLYAARWQWNFLGRVLGFSQSDIGRRGEPAASLSIAGATNRSRFTRFSSAGGGQLEGFGNGESGQYDTEQWMLEAAYQSKGLSFQGEYHEKDIEDRATMLVTELSGYYAQLGYFFHELSESFPQPLEMAVRYARVDRASVPELSGEESTLAVNWFFSGHNNKITADFSHLRDFEEGPGSESGWRARLQWDVSF